MIILFILVLDEEGIAKLASAFQLFIFMLVNLAVIVMRESKITAYDPGFESPLYPWMQLFGILASLVLIAAMGWLAILFTLGIVVLCLVWFHHYARHRVARDGAIYHWFARLGQSIDRDLDVELRSILKEKGLREEDPFEQTVADAPVLDLEYGQREFGEIIDEIAGMVISQMPDKAELLRERFEEVRRSGPIAITQGVALPHLHLPGIEKPRMIIVRSRDGIHCDGEMPVYALFMLISDEEKARQHLRMLAQLAVSVDEEDFVERWRAAKNEQALKEMLLRDERFLSLTLRAGTPTGEFIGKPLREVPLPENTLVVMIRRGHRTLIPHGNTVLRDGDRLTIIGDPKEIRTLYRRYVSMRQPKPAKSQPPG